MLKFTDQRFVTDAGKLSSAGTVKKEFRDYFLVNDRRIGREFKIPKDRAIQMTQRQIESYNAKPFAGDIERQIIIKRSAEVRAANALNSRGQHLPTP